MPRKKKRSHARKATLRAGVLAGVVLLGIAAFAALRYLTDNRLPNVRAEKHLFVYPDTPAGAVLDSLSACVRHPGSLRRMFRSKEVARYLQPGHYLLRPGQTSVYVARMLNNGWQTPVRLTLSGTLRLKGDIARKISAQMMLDSASVHHALEDAQLLGKFGYTPRSVFSLLMPDTYELYWTDSMEQVFATQKKAQEAFWTAERVALARAQDLTPAEVSVLASIVKGESNYEPEFPKIAGVYLNRLHKGMKLQADPTVAFCHGYTLNRIYKAHLKVDSPYNTYKYAGLPPGPICVPTRACLEAVLRPDGGGGNLYFCADPSFNGSHRFARTYAEHMKNARSFQRALDGRAKRK